MEFLNSIKNCVLEIYVIVPFICALVLSAFTFLRNPVYIRGLSKVFLSIQFFIASAIFLCVDNANFNIFGFDFLFTKIEAIFLFVLNFIFLLLLFISKTFITKNHRAFYSIFILLYALLNAFVVADNLFLILPCMFVFILLGYFLNEIYTKKENRKILKYNLIFDSFWYLLASSLIGFDFIRYFVLNSVELNFSQLSNYLYHINDNSISLAFFGFLILIFKFFNLIPFSIKNFKSIHNTEFFVTIIDNIVSLLISMTLFIKVYLVFNYLFYQNQNAIAFILLLNFIYFVILSFREDSLNKFSLAIVPIVMISGMFCIFTFENSGIASFIYYFVASIVSVLLLFLVFALLQNKFKTDKIEDLIKISSKSKMAKIFTVFSILNLAKVPFFAMFCAMLISFVLIFSTAYESSLLNLAPYLLLFGNFILSLNLLNIVYKVLIEPYGNAEIDIIFSKHQMVPLVLLGFFILIIAFSAQNIFNLLIDIINIGEV